MGVSLRKLERLARKYKVKVARQDIHTCALGVLREEGKALGLSFEDKSDLAKRYKMTWNNILNVEAGFEGWDEKVYQNFGQKFKPNNRYYKIGKRFAERMGVA